MRAEGFIAALLVFAMTANGYAQESALTAEQLSARLAALKQELAREQNALRQQRALQARELEQLKAQRGELAESVLSNQVTSDRQQNELKALRSQVETADADAKEAVDQAEAITGAVRDAAIQLRLHLRELPGTEQAIESIREAASIAWNVEQQDRAEIESKTNQIFAAIDRFHQGATSVTLTETDVYTASGDLERVDLLAIGHVRFAYVTIDGGRVGLALSSPQDASGFRWSEELPPSLERNVKDALIAIDSKQEAVVSIPLDPTGRIQPETLTQTESLQDRIVDGGPVMVPLGVLAVVAMLLILERWVVLFLFNRGSGRLSKRVVNACRAGKFDQAMAACKRSSGAVSRVLASCLARRESGSRAMEDSIQEQMLHELPRLRRSMRGIAMLAAIAPLFGLLGTVTGIIRTFGVIKAFGNANPTLMAGGISEALLTTAVGLSIAIPLLIVHSLLRSRADKIIADCESRAARLLTTLTHDKPETNGTAMAPSRAEDSSDHRALTEVATDDGDQVGEELSID